MGKIGHRSPSKGKTWPKHWSIQPPTRLICGIMFGSYLKTRQDNQQSPPQAFFENTIPNHYHAHLWIITQILYIPKYSRIFSMDISMARIFEKLTSSLWSRHGRHQQIWRAFCAIESLCHTLRTSPSADFPMTFPDLLSQWPFQEPKLEVPTIYKAYLRAMIRGYTPKIWPYMVQYLHFRILEFPLIEG
jgi:hypothetical protein